MEKVTTDRTYLCGCVGLIGLAVCGIVFFGIAAIWWAVHDIPDRLAVMDERRAEIAASIEDLSAIWKDDDLRAKTSDRLAELEATATKHGQTIQAIIAAVNEMRTAQATPPARQPSRQPITPPRPALPTEDLQPKSTASGEAASGDDKQGQQPEAAKPTAE